MPDSPPNSSPNPSRSIRFSHLGVCLLLLIATICVYWPVRHFAFINLDDPQYIYSNPHVLTGLTQSNIKWAFTYQIANWAPLTLLSYMIDVQVFGPSASAMHVENMLIHAVAACLWCMLLIRMTDRPGPSFAVAALFAFHPAHIESVAWISERKDVLSMLLMPLSLLLYHQYTRKHTALPYVLSLLIYALGLMSKAMIVTQPLLMLLLDLWPLHRATALNPALPQWRKLLIEKIPFFALALITCILTVKAQATVGAMLAIPNLSFQDRIANAILNYIRYLGLAVYPHNLSIFYPYQFGTAGSAVGAAGVLLLLITTVAMRAWPRRPYLLVGWLWFLGTLVPVIGLVQVGMQSIADRYTYLPFIGLFIAIVWLIADLTSRSKSARLMAMAISALVLIACAVATHRLLPIWTNTITLFTHAEASVNPDWNIEEHLAAGYADDHQPYPAIEHYEISVQLRTDNYGGQASLANLLVRYSPAQALPHYQAAIRLDPGNAIAHYNYAICLQTMHRDDQANVEFERAKQLDPRQGITGVSPVGH